MSIDKPLGAIILFANAMDFSDISQLPAALQRVATYRQLMNEQTLFDHNEPAQVIYAVKSGRIRLLHYTKSGQAISHYAVHAGEICAEVALFSDIYTCSAVVETSTQVLALPKQAFLDALQNFDFATAFMAQLSYRLHTTKAMMEIRSIRSAQERVLHYLRLIAPSDHNTVVLKQPLKNIAADLSISPEALSRTLTQLESEGTIMREKSRIILLESA